MKISTNSLKFTKKAMLIFGSSRVKAFEFVVNDFYNQVVVAYTAWYLRYGYPVAPGGIWRLSPYGRDNQRKVYFFDITSFQ